MSARKSTAIAAPKMIGIAGLLAAALTTNFASAAQFGHERHYRASMPASSRAVHYAPDDYARYDLRVPPPSQAPAFIREPWLSDINSSAP